MKPCYAPCAAMLRIGTVRTGSAGGGPVASSTSSQNEEFASNADRPSCPDVGVSFAPTHATRNSSLLFSRLRETILPIRIVPRKPCTSAPWRLISMVVNFCSWEGPLASLTVSNTGTATSTGEIMPLDLELRHQSTQ